ncbi:transcriptional regulator GcvA [Paludibacterium paludis]|uniref:Transcriptional regulator n=1 Tax=Paludibacterium paludis TaxID=1225769 RepID=A0A918U962_9NEIS|nr:transcriptional regulator GcvA [Paludibacterium paludis]GGY11897.1 transcriptional regulator [Paludibacterium paludis]
MQLPSLVAIRFFEAVARHLSVKHAAHELHVTSGAVSQQVRKLEDALGRTLFERRPRGLSLTADGRDYFAACQEALTLIERATRRLTEERRTIRVSCTPTFGVQWLTPRLQDFLSARPDLDVHVITTNRLVDLAREPVDFAIRHGLGEYEGLVSTRLIADDLIPVCHPDLASSRHVLSIGDIVADRLLHDEKRDDWRLWCEAVGARDIDCSRGIVFSESNAVIEAALAGRGFALAKRAMVSRELAAGRLVTADLPALETPFAYYLVRLADVPLAAVAQTLFDWLLARVENGAG